MDYIRLLAKLGKKAPGIAQISNRITPKQFSKAVEYLYPDTLCPVDITGGAVLVSGALFGLSTIILSLFVNPISAFVLGITIGLMSYFISMNGLISRYNSQLVQIEKVAPYVLEELATIYLTTGSVFEAIQYVSKGEYSLVSEAFLKMIMPLNQGEAPERLLMDFAINQPSFTLRRGLLAFIQFIESSTSNLDAVIVDAHENIQRRYEKLTIQWESRMMVYTGLLVFLPIIIILGLAIRGLVDNPLILLLPVFQFGFSKLLHSSLLPNENILLGE
ncbi:MAG: hypothetical protein ACFFAL_07160 [Promethearchaeota archaeon]